MGYLENHGRLSASFNLNHKKGKIMEMTKNMRSIGRGTKSLAKSLFNSIVFGKEIIMKKIKRSHGRRTKSLAKSLFNSIVFGKEIIMKKIKMKKRFGLNRQKSRGIVENGLSGTKAGFKAILNLVFNQKKEALQQNLWVNFGSGRSPIV